MAADGQVGPLTIAAVRAATLNDILLRFDAYRLRHYTSLSTWGTYGKRWTNRTAGQLDYASKEN